MKSIILFISVLLIASSYGQIIPAESSLLTTKNDELRYNQLMNELRCLVCQNQTLADSNAELAQDLRLKIATMISDGATDTDIKNYMVERYGEFVLYRPRLNYATTLLWIGPFVLLLIALGVVATVVRSSKGNAGKSQTARQMTDGKDNL